jgi:hypothetical protein
MLVLHGRRFDAFFSTKPSWKMDLPDVPRTTLSLRELLNRARSVDVELGELELATADGRRVKYADPNETDIAQDGRLVDVGDALGRDAYVRYAVALISGGARHMRCQFERGTASARTNGTFYLSEMLGIGLPLLERLRAGDQRAIRELISNDDPAEAL